MINLLPPANLREIRATQHNSVLIRYTIAAAVIACVIIFVYIAMFVVTRNAEQTNAELSSSSKQKIDQLTATKNEAAGYTKNLRIAKQLLDSRASYAAALHKIARTLPQETVLQSIILDPSTITDPTALSFSAKTTEKALSIKDQLEKSDIASDITIASLSEGGENADADYPVSITLNLTLQASLFTPEEES